jgi:ABC-type transport system involved in multi-copper enzyme maturation permease subunit
MKFANILFGLFVAINLLGVISAAATQSNIAMTLGQVCGTVKNVLAVGMLLLVVLAAVIYAVGQVLGAETRARASVWATAMFIGAIIGALIYILLPYIMGLLIVGDATKGSSWMTTCCKTDVTAATAGGTDCSV